MRILLLIILAVLAAACGREPVFVVPKRLAQGDDGTAIQAAPSFDILVVMGADSTDFDPEDLMILEVDGVDRAVDMIIGSDWALLRIDPPPIGMHSVELFRRKGSFIDNFTWMVEPYTGATLASATPNTGRAGAPVLIAGTGFDAGTVRVFFGGVEATIDSSTATTISTTVPIDAGPGLVWVLIGDEAASGIVGFQPLDDMDEPILFGTEPQIFATFPGSAPVEFAVQFYGVNFENTYRPTFNDERSEHVFGVEIVDVPPIGLILTAFAVADDRTESGDGLFVIELNSSVGSNALPFTVK